jgi:putative transposase
VVNRGNDRRVIFPETCDYEMFMRLVRAGTRRFAIAVHAHCVMPNHFHLLVEVIEDEALSAYMQWVTGCYACYLRTRTKTVGHGHVFQRRFWSVGIDDTLHFLVVRRYIEANPRRAKLVERAEQWQWSSLANREQADTGSRWCVALPDDWCELVNEVQVPEVLERLRMEITPKPGRPRVVK